MRAAALGGALVLVLAGCGGEKRDCGAGFDARAWSGGAKAHARAGKAIADCDLLDGRSRAEVRGALGRADERSATSWRWILDDTATPGPTLRLLELRFDAHDRVTDSRTVERPY